MDHIFIDLGHASNPRIETNPDIAVVRTDMKGNVLATYSDKAVPTRIAIEDMQHSILHERFDNVYVVVSSHTDTVRTFLKGHKGEDIFSPNWVDILALAWPLCYTNTLSSRTLESLCRHFEIINPAPNTATGNCEALVGFPPPQETFYIASS